MTDPSTPAGHDALHAVNMIGEALNIDIGYNEWRKRIRAIEAEARAEGCRKAVHAIRSEFSLNAWPCHECDNAPMLDAILDAVAGLNASEPPPPDQRCEADDAGKVCGRHYEQKIGCPIHGYEAEHRGHHVLVNGHGNRWCQDCETWVYLRAASEPRSTDDE